MSILKYFKRVDNGSCSNTNTLPDPEGPLSTSVPSEAIATANKRVRDVLDKSSDGKKSQRGSYQILTPAQKLLIGQRAAEFGTTAAIKCFAKKYPELSLKETTVRRLKNQYQDELHVKQEVPTAEAFAGKKNGRPLMIGEELDKQVQEYITYMRSTGTTVNTAVVIACAEGILMHEDTNLLTRVDLSKGWAQYLLKRMGYVKRKATSKAKITVDNFAEIKEDFLLEVKHVIAMDEIPTQLVINFDQTGLNIVPVSDWTMEVEGAKRVEVAGKDNKKQITAVLGGSCVGDFLPPQIIYEGKTPRCLPKYDFPEKWHITYSTNHWSNETTMKEYVDNILLPYVKEKRTNLNLADDYPALVLFDNFKAQCTPRLLTLLDQNNINVVLIPPNCTDRLQPLDVSVNKAVKNQLQTQFQSWYAQQVCHQRQEGEEKKPIDLKLSAIKPLSASWIVAACNYLKNKPEIIINGFKETGIASCT